MERKGGDSPSGGETSPRAVYSTADEDFTYVGVNIPCQKACPAGTNIPAYIRALYEERYGDSYEINRRANVLPGVLGRICSRPCEGACRHGEPELGRPVNICHLKRAAADLREGPEPPPTPPMPGRKVAVVGSGPAGLAAAHELAALGAAVTLYEALDHPGGMLRYGIPEFRLPRKVLQEEIDAILNLGVVLKTGVTLGSDLSVEDILGGHDALLLAAGCYRSNSLGVPGEDLPGVHSGLEFMMALSRGEAPATGERVMVIGDGFTAFDCARSALRRGARDVRICMLQTEEDLAVTEDEIRDATAEGVTFESLVISQRITGEGRVEGVEFARTRPGAAGEASPIKGSEFTIGADAVIVAIGQRPEPLAVPGEKDGRGVPLADRESLRTTAPGLYVAGDYLTGPSTVIEAVAMGRRAAARILQDLNVGPLPERAVRMEESVLTDRERTWDYLPRQEMPALGPVSRRLGPSNPEVETGFTPEMAAGEAKRCYLCYLHYEIDMSRCIYCRYCIDAAPRDCIKLVKEVRTDESGAVTGLESTSRWREVHAVVIDNARCIRCGACVRVCPVDCISVTKVEGVERVNWEVDRRD
jgi:glutamate synthase (NADPH/NADH) small chain